MQAARGTSVATPPARRPRRLRLLFVSIALTAYVVDQVTKALAVVKLDGRDDVQVVGDLLRLHLTRNPGAAFSLGTEFTPVLGVLAMAAAVVVVWFARRIGSAGWATALGFLLAGIVGNLTDRIVRPPSVMHGHVVDFLRLPHWPIFNVADICINVAAVLIVILAFRGIRLDGSRVSDAGATEEDAEEDVEEDAEESVGGTPSTPSTTPTEIETE
ncbi:hypothetical protein BH11ACT8_BH11ACT8_25480 [soil metagenome]